VASAKISPHPRETERKLKLLQVCPRNLSHCRGAPQRGVPSFVPTTEPYRVLRAAGFRV
jgi:hypothetical protein